MNLIANKCKTTIYETLHKLFYKLSINLDYKGEIKQIGDHVEMIAGPCYTVRLPILKVVRIDIDPGYVPEMQDNYRFMEKHVTIACLPVLAEIIPKLTHACMFAGQVVQNDEGFFLYYGIKPFERRPM